MKVVLLLGLVGAAIYGAILLSYDLLPHAASCVRGVLTFPH